MQFHKLAAEIFVQELTETLRESRESQTETQIAAQVDFIGNTDPDLRGLRISVESPNGTVRSASITSAGFDWAKNEQSFSGETITTTPDNIAQHTQFFTENLPLDLIRLTGA
jgi:Rad3-related DNA helicase